VPEDGYESGAKLKSRKGKVVERGVVAWWVMDGCG
jgi:hypothetical protein